MRTKEPYWTFKSPPTPELLDLPDGIVSGDEGDWGKLSPMFRREVWRDALIREAKSRELPPRIIERLSLAIGGGSSLVCLDDYLEVFRKEDEARPPLQQDAERIERADTKERQSAAQISARETL